MLKRTLREFNGDHLTDLAAALTYYGVLAIFPMLIVIVSVLGLLGNSVTQSLVNNLGAVAPGAARTIFTNAITNIQSHQGAAGIAFIIGLVVALWSASAYIAAFMRASNVIWDVPEGRPIYKTLPIRLVAGHDRTPVIDAEHEIAATHLENLNPLREIREIALERILVTTGVYVPQRRGQQLPQRDDVAVCDRVASSLFQLQKLIDQPLIVFVGHRVGPSSMIATTRDGAALARLILSGKQAMVNPVAGSESRLVIRSICE